MKRTPLKRKTGLKPSRGKLKKTPLKKVSSKRAKRNREKTKTYEELDKDFNGVCSGCGQRKWPITHSHLVPESYNADLVSEKKNIRHHCMECHLKWEVNSREASEMLDYTKNIQRIKELDYSYYLKFTSKHE